MAILSCIALEKDTESMDASARLIASAPDLVNSLTDCANQLRMFLELHEDDEDAPKILETANKLLDKINRKD